MRGAEARSLACAAALAATSACGSTGTVTAESQAHARGRARRTDAAIVRARPDAASLDAGDAGDAGGLDDGGVGDGGAPDAGDPVIDADNETLERGHASHRAVRVLSGRVSYYADWFAGRRTANGETYDPRRLTAASRTLPFGTIVRVVREGRTVVVRVNDRGPFRDHSRLLDLSRAAAERLGIVQRGVARVRLEILAFGRGRVRASRPRRSTAR